MSLLCLFGHAWRYYRDPGGSDAVVAHCSRCCRTRWIWR